jgi:pimeloyl-ACP methyl ester carboxylesterase
MRYITYRLGGYFRRMNLLIAGDPALPVLVCVHGLSRNAHDFDRVAAALSDRFHVIAVDLPGRGDSDWLEQPALYNPAAYCEALSHLLSWIDRPVNWLGTSLGGICGMILAAAPGSPIRRLILNDVGPFIPAASLKRIGSYVMPPERFEDLAAVEAHLRRTQAGFAPMDDEDWRNMTLHSSRPLPDGGFRLHYDPAIAAPFAAAEPQDVDLWAVYRAIACPRLVIRGGWSDLLTAEHLADLAAGGAWVHTVPEAGHAPSLHDEGSLWAIANFLGEG